MIFYTNPNTGDYFPADRAFTLDGIKYPRNWLSGLSDAEISAMGLVEYTPPEPPQPVPDRISKSQLLRQLRRAGYVTTPEAKTWAAGNALPAVIQALVDGMPANDQADAEILLLSMQEAHRGDPLVAGLAQANGLTDAQVDNLFRAAAAI